MEVFQFWHDKYRPKTFDELNYNFKLSEQLKNLAKVDDFPHLLIYGPSGSGKKTRIHLFLKELLGNDVTKVTVEPKVVNIDKSSIEIIMTQSSSHIEFSLSDYGAKDKDIIQKVIKDLAEIRTFQVSDKPYKVIVLHHAEQLSFDAQHALRRTMEIYVKNCRLIMVCNSTSQILGALKSRSLLLRVEAPSISQIVEILVNICKKENLTPTPAFLEKIAIDSERNLRKAILMLETAKNSDVSFSDDSQMTILQPEWESFLKQIAIDVMTNDEKNLLMIRNKFYDLLNHAIPEEVIFKKLTEEFLTYFPVQFKFAVIQNAAKYEHRSKVGLKDIVHLETFVLQIMKLNIEMNERK